MSDDEYMKALELQRKNFEAQFGSLEEIGYEDKTKSAPDEQAMSDSNFSGFLANELDSESEGSSSLEEEIGDSESEESEEEVPAKPKVIRIQDNHTSAPILSRKDQKLLRSGRVPTIAEIEENKRASAKSNKQVKKEEDENLENDVKLQRLLQDSHILSKQMEYSGADLTLLTLDYEEPTGKARKKILTSKLRDISATNSSTNGLPKKLEKMPMAMRKGMIQSREKKIAKYEQEAREAGIVLSKVKRGQLRDLDIGKGSTFASDRLGTGKKIVNKVRDRGLKIQSVGRSTRNGLVISADEINRINKNGDKKKGKKSRGRR